jgi:hypothetical protein
VLAGHFSEVSGLVADNPAPSWLPQQSWEAVKALSVIDTFQEFTHQFATHLSAFKSLYESESPHSFAFPESLRYSQVQVCACALYSPCDE